MDGGRLPNGIDGVRGRARPAADQFVSMYVNDGTLDYGERGRRAVQTLLDRGFVKGLLPRAVQAEFVEAA